MYIMNDYVDGLANRVSQSFRLQAFEWIRLNSPALLQIRWL
jgi:hypothetical protein